MPGFQQGFALIIGIANYPNVRKLPTAVLNDATQVAMMLKRQDRGGYANDHVKVLLDKDATRESILAGLDWLATISNATPDATAVFYFSGHGGHFSDGPDAGNYLIGFDTQLRSIKQTAISSDSLTSALDKLQTQRVVIIVDACYSAGTVVTNKGDLVPDDVINLPQTAKGDLAPDEPVVAKGLDEGAFDKLAHGGGRIVLASSGPNETSLILPGEANSLFTDCLLDAMNGKASYTTPGQLRVFDLTSYVLDEVPKRSPAQNPLYKGNGTNFPLALLFGGNKSLMPVAPATPIDSSSTKPDMPKTDMLVLKQQTELAPPAVTMQLKNFMLKRLEAGALEDLCSDISGYISTDGFDDKTAAPDLFGLSLAMIGASGNSYALQLNKLIDFVNKRYKLPYLIYALSQRFPGEKITDWQADQPQHIERTASVPSSSRTGG